MIEEIVINYLSDKLSVPVTFEKQENPPESYVILEKTGSGVEDWIFTATIAVQSYAASMYEAASLNAQIIELMMAMPDEIDDVSACDLNSDYNFTDVTSREYRYQAVFDIVY